MIHTLFTIFRLSQAYGANGFLYRLRCLPILKTLIPAKAYGSSGVKKIAWIGAAAVKTVMAFGGKFLYLFLFLILPVQYLGIDTGQKALHVLVILSAAGGYLNEELFQATKEKYYAIILMHMDAGRYVVSSFLWFLIKTGITFLPAILILGSLAGMSRWMCLLIPVIALSSKCIVSALLLKYYEKTGNVNMGTNLKLTFAVSAAALALAYLPPMAGYSLPVWFSVLMAGLLAAGALCCQRYLRCYPSYGQLSKRLLTQNTILFGTAEATSQALQKTNLSRISDEQVQTGKRGYEAFNEIFVARHKKILTHSARRTALILGALFLAAIAVGCVSDEFSRKINGFLMSFLPYFVFIMYGINKGQAVTQAMFMNCDHSMLAYRFYRQPETILKLFQIRLKTLITINLVPALVVALGLPTLLLVTGGTDNPANYLALFVSILAMAVFFSVHHLTLYYLLQPYNVNLESKSSAYAIANSITYVLCYLCIRFQAPTLLFASLTIVIALIYIGIALALVYRYAPRRFRLK